MELNLLKDIEPREYQTAIAETALQSNTLVVLPTGMGKTLIAVLVGIERLEKFPGSQILITAPTRPLNAQHKKSFEKFTVLDPKEIVLITGRVLPSDRAELYKMAKVIISTPQCIENDLRENRLNLENFSFVTFDEAHRSVKAYAYTFIAKKYKEQSKFPLILGLTASPGGSFDRIERIRQSLFIEAVEIRSEQDKDVEAYVKPIEKEWVYIDFPEEFARIKSLLEEKLKEDFHWLKEHHAINTYRPSKSVLLALQKRLGARMSATKNYALMWVVVKTAEAIKLDHAIELLETQGVSSVNEYFHKLCKSGKKTDARLVQDPRIVEAMKAVSDLCEKGIEHPKLDKLRSVVTDLVKGDSKIKIIVFANFRSTVEKIKDLLEANGVSCDILIGQATRETDGLTQEQQIEALQRFEGGEFNVLIGTSVSEEGLSVPAVDYVIFYESVPSEIRTIQRRGRTGRTQAGKTIFLLTKDTRDEAYYWTAFKKEKMMKGILYDMKNEMKRKKNSLDGWLR